MTMKINSLRKALTLSVLSCILITAGCANTDATPQDKADISAVETDISTADTDISAAETDTVAQEPIAVPTPDEEEPIIVKTPDYEELQTPDYEEPQTPGINGDYIDLTVMSSTVVYGQVYNMMYYPENFVGKTIKMKGLFSDYFDQASGKRYFACIIMDATACCSQGIEFILTEDYKYPEDYPGQGDEITVEGIFDIYEEEDGPYCTLRQAKLIS